MNDRRKSLRKRLSEVPVEKPTQNNNNDCMDTNDDHDSGIEDCIHIQEDSTPKAIPQPPIQKTIRKRPRYSDPGPRLDIRHHAKISKQRRRQTLGVPSELKEASIDQSIVQYLPISTQLNPRLRRQLKRQNLSDVMNKVNLDEKNRKRKEQELVHLRIEIQKLKDSESNARATLRNKRVSDVTDAKRMQDIQTEVEDLRRQVELKEIEQAELPTDMDWDSYEPPMYLDHSDDEDMPLAASSEYDKTPVPHRRLSENPSEFDEGVSMSQDPLFSSQENKSQDVQKVKNLQFSLDQEQTIRIQAECKLETIAQDYNKLRSEFHSAMNTISSLQQSKRQQEQEELELRRPSGESADYKNMLIIQKQASIDDLSAKLEDSIETQHRRSAELQSLEQQSDELAKMISQLEGSQEQLVKELQIASNDKKELGNKLVEERLRNEILQTTVEENEEKINGLVSMINYRDSQIEELRSELQAANEALEDIEEEQESKEQSALATISSIESRLADAVQAKVNVEKDLCRIIKEKKATIKEVREQLMLSEREHRETQELLHGTQVELEVTQRAGHDLQKKLAEKTAIEIRLRKGLEMEMRRFSEGVAGLFGGGRASRRPGGDSGIGMEEADFEEA